MFSMSGVEYTSLLPLAATLRKVIAMYVGAPSRLLVTSILTTSPFLAEKEYQSRSRRFSTTPAISQGSAMAWAVSGVSLAPLSRTTGAVASAIRKGLDEPAALRKRYSKPSMVTEEG